MAVAGPAEVETTIQRLSQHRNVRGVIILSREGVVIRSSGPIFQGADGHVILRRYASEARKIVDAVADSVDHIELEVRLILSVSLSLKSFAQYVCLFSFPIGPAAVFENQNTTARTAHHPWFVFS
jgi:hypothetical protein